MSDMGRTLGDLFVEAAEQGDRRSTQTILNEQAPPPPPVEPPAQPPAQPSQSFVPDGFKNPQELRRQRQEYRAQWDKLQTKLGKARAESHSQNPYARRNDSGGIEFDQMAYNDDMREISRLDTLMREIDMELGQAQTVVAGTMGRIKKAFVDAFLRNEKQLKYSLSQAQAHAARVAYNNAFENLERNGFFNNPTNLNSGNIESTAAMLFRNAVGEAFMTAGGETPGRRQGQTEADAETEKEEQPWEGWNPDAQRMWDSFQKAKTSRGKTLADIAREQRRQQGGN